MFPIEMQQFTFSAIWFKSRVWDRGFVLVQYMICAFLSKYIYIFMISYESNNEKNFLLASTKPNVM